MKNRIFPFATVHRIIERDGSSITLHPEFGEKIPRHADCLHYDAGFCNPKQIEQVVFPIFKSKHGRSTSTITKDRWRSFGLLVESMDEQVIEDVGSWITYRHADEDALKELVPVTLDEWLARHPGDKVAMWR